MEAKFATGSKRTVRLFGTFERRMGTRAACLGGIVTFATTLTSPRLKLKLGEVEQHIIISRALVQNKYVQ